MAVNNTLNDWTKWIFKYFPSPLTTTAFIRCQILFIIIVYPADGIVNTKSDLQAKFPPGLNGQLIFKEILNWDCEFFQQSGINKHSILMLTAKTLSSSVFSVRM